MLGEPPVGRYHYQAFLHKRVRVPLPLIVLLLAGWLVVVGYRAVAWLILDFSSAGPCPRCNTVFSMINTTNSEDRVKIVEIQQRGEPKSGTTFMYQWAHGALVHTCEYLRQWYGQDTCHLERSTPIGRQKGFHEGIVLKFTPRRRSVLRSRCPCDEVDRVEIGLYNGGKHKLPVRRDCAWFHPNGLTGTDVACPSVDGRPVENYLDLWGCMREAACKIEDDDLQFVTLRDPRAVAVSTYFHVQTHPLAQGGHNPILGDSLETAVLIMLPRICQWLTIRHLLFEGLLPDQSTSFWYDEALSNPLRWHHRWLTFAGLHLPARVVAAATDAAVGGELQFMSTGLNSHPGGVETGNERNWRDEISPAVRAEMDAVMRTWLPPVLVARFGAWA